MKAKLKYIPMPGSRIGSEAAKSAGKELDRIHRRHGSIKPEIIVEESVPETAPLHKFFTWDNGDAAHKWRIEEARSIIRSVRVVRDDQPQQEQPVIRAFLNVQASDTEAKFEGKAYLPLRVIRESPDYMQQVVNEAMRELKAWKSRYEDLRTTFEGVFAEIEAVES